MREQASDLCARGIAAGCLASSQSPAADRSILQQLEGGGLRLLYLSPERLVTACRAPGNATGGALRKLAAAGKLQQLVVDECHVISSWGLDFRRVCRELSCFRCEFPTVPILAVTATAPPRVRSDVMSVLSMPSGACLVCSCARPNLMLRVLPSGTRSQRIQEILRLLRNAGCNGASLPRAIIYVRTRALAPSIASALSAAGVPTEAYHAGLGKRQKVDLERRWQAGELRCMAATVAWGMGMDCPDVRLVVHESPPASVDRWWQEAGRAGRDGAAAECVLFASAADMRSLEHVAVSHAGREAVATMSRIALDTTRCRHQSILSEFGECIAPCGGCCDVCSGTVRSAAARPRIPLHRAALSTRARPSGRAQRPCPRCGYALLRACGPYGPYRRCSRRQQGCRFTRDLSPEGLRTASHQFVAEVRAAASARSGLHEGMARKRQISPAAAMRLAPPVGAPSSATTPPLQRRRA